MEREVKLVVKTMLLNDVSRPQSKNWCDDFIKGYTSTGESVDDEFVDWLYSTYSGS